MSNTSAHPPDVILRMLRVLNRGLRSRDTIQGISDGLLACQMGPPRSLEQMPDSLRLTVLSLAEQLINMRDELVKSQEADRLAAEHIDEYATPDYWNQTKGIITHFSHQDTISFLNEKPQPIQPGEGVFEVVARDLESRIVTGNTSRLINGILGPALRDYDAEVTYADSLTEEVEDLRHQLARKIRKLDGLHALAQPSTEAPSVPHPGSSGRREPSSNTGRSTGSTQTAEELEKDIEDMAEELVKRIVKERRQKNVVRLYEAYDSLKRAAKELCRLHNELRLNGQRWREVPHCTSEEKPSSWNIFGQAPDVKHIFTVDEIVRKIRDYSWRIMRAREDIDSEKPHMDPPQLGILLSWTLVTICDYWMEDALCFRDVDPKNDLKTNKLRFKEKWKSISLKLAGQDVGLVGIFSTDEEKKMLEEFQNLRDCLLTAIMKSVDELPDCIYKDRVLYDECDSKTDAGSDSLRLLARSSLITSRSAILLKYITG
ncbi:hypothetical protein BJ508DRAFT_54007 [Ascobolus immersus RN42]|uniref:Uncharacterized protein n=1 Tax=Ascobolus immersus RN42 TaxID=1160509 RepID=A0A3N4HKZ8_ASCIM|nr:hypothetical protein BJ508DRAFT_54007 [Ascobolus immersus RN42]